MALLSINNVRISGVAAAVPKDFIESSNSSIFASEEDALKFVNTTGIFRRHIVGNRNICTSDLCFHACDKLLVELGWQRDEIDVLIFVSQTPDYILPATACILQDRLGLSKDCLAFDISLGCSGWVYGLSTISSLLSSGSLKKGLLLVGDTTTVTKSEKDKSTFPLFGDAGTATALEFKDNENHIMNYHFGTDGSGFEAIMIKDGGFRNFFNTDSLKERQVDTDIIRNDLQSILDGPAVFIFGITRVPKAIKELLRHFEIAKDEIDYFVMHQANKFMNEKIREKVGIEASKTPYSMQFFGNTSSASIPLTMVSSLSSELRIGEHKLLASGFGVGLSWGSVYFKVTNLVIPEVIYL